MVIKVLGQDFDSSGAASALKGFDGHGAVQVLESVTDALLLERLQPGATLGDTLKDDLKVNDIKVFCDVARKLHSAEIPIESAPSLMEWPGALDRPSSSALDRLGAEKLDRARVLFTTLWNTAPNKIVLHGDLHHDNILLDQSKGWLAIDPKGVVGEPAFEAAAFLRNPVEFSKKFTQRHVLTDRIEKVVAGTGWTGPRIIQWAYCQNVLSAVWSIQSNEDPTSALNLVNALEPMLATA